VIAAFIALVAAEALASAQAKTIFAMASGVPGGILALAILQNWPKARPVIAVRPFAVFWLSALAAAAGLGLIGIDPKQSVGELTAPGLLGATLLSGGTVVMLMARRIMRMAGKL
jgi:hypothetical protein